MPDILSQNEINELLNNLTSQSTVPRSAKNRIGSGKKD